MKNIFLRITAICLLLAAQGLRAQVRVLSGKEGVTLESPGGRYVFAPAFTILYNAADPGMALKPAGIKKVSYNVLSWKVKDSGKADLVQQRVSAAVAGDGFDDKILRGKKEQRTVSIQHAGEKTELRANGMCRKGDTAFFSFPPASGFVLTAYAVTNTRPYPLLRFSFTPTKPGYYSIGYTGAPSFSVDKTAALWQPMIWQEKRVPDASYLTPAFMAPLPTTMVYDGRTTVGVLASPEHLPFQPLPTLPNSQFGIALRNAQGLLQPQLYAPIPGGYGSLMKSGETFSFAMQLVAEPQDITHTYQTIAENIFGFRDYRHNDIASLNTVLDNMTAYAMTHYAWFIDSLKGFAYSTDVPGAVKNVSSLNPLELALVRDDARIFEQRAYPLMEYMLSREKFLFSLDSLQKIQNPSRRLKGPVAPLSELGALYSVFGKENDFYLRLMRQEYGSSRMRNLDVKEDGGSWTNAMRLYKATGEKQYLDAAIHKANEYLAKRERTPQSDFSDPSSGGFFFWPGYTNRWIGLSELYELTGDTTYLRAAVQGARNYTLFTWMSPAVPDSLVTVNKGGKAPMYWYLRSKGHAQMYYPEEKAPAWRLSETGLTPESSGTATGHRAIFMANYAPWMLRIGYYAKDTFLINVAKAAVIGRYRSFPGYHINTERTTAYEKEDFPLHEHKAQSVNSFHYNHILPMASMVIDYLVTDAFVRSQGKIDFPAEFIEGYAYLQNKMYGSSAGRFYTEKDAQLWMPSGLLRCGNVELNYIAARKGNKLLLAFTNQSAAAVTGSVTVNPSLVKLSSKSNIRSFTRNDAPKLRDSVFTITVPANGIAAVAVENATPDVKFQQILSVTGDKGKDYAEIKTGNAKALLFKLGAYGRRLYVYLEDDDNKWRSVRLHYTDASGQTKQVEDDSYPFELTVPLEKPYAVQCWLTLEKAGGGTVNSEKITLGN
ncbi:hypothetical protein ACFOTA_08025 [Chitinophaga sp. GCM10012297]|uniref:Alpha-L-rhamnosidase six-hairpin glycosidase domain-containing protein n=1 Tax=Chitinophaga chungangae TaxID=2821488 RepID=A0ABS3YBU1_9BACT|nr:hypothetical protein [Chitinophaga chungangae]MBO9152150.1 hypothetical protein [Chitinophaga chungangae]